VVVLGKDIVFDLKNRFRQLDPELESLALLQ
jgi:hypothetical protein